MTDLEIAESFFLMLKKHGVTITEDFDCGKEFTVVQSIVYGGNNKGETITFCFDEEGNYWRIMGYVGDFYTDEIHKKG